MKSNTVVVPQDKEGRSGVIRNTGNIRYEIQVIILSFHDPVKQIEFIDKTSLFKVILREPNQQPIVGEGLYQYTTFNNEIEILNTLSSCTCSKKAVYFKVFENNTFEIGDFYKSNSSNNTLKFRKQ